MRFLVKVSIDTATTNEAIKNNKLGETLNQIMGDLQPEAAYFISEDGGRTALLFVNMESNADLVNVCEPWWLAFNAKVEITPAMNGEDLEKAGPAFGAIVEKYG